MWLILRPWSLLSNLIGIGLILWGCGQTFNSNSEDYALIPSNYCTDPLDTQLCNANEILQTQCANCHTANYHISWAVYSTNQEWIDDTKAGIVPGDPSSSLLYQKLLGTASGQIMPPTGSLTTEEIQIISDWITGL